MKDKSSRRWRFSLPSLIKIKAIALLTDHGNIFDWLNKISYELSKSSKWAHLISAVWSLSLNIFTSHTLGGILVKVGVKLVFAMSLYSPASQRKFVQRKYGALISQVLPCEYWGWVLNSHNKILLQLRNKSYVKFELATFFWKYFRYCLANLKLWREYFLSHFNLKTDILFLYWIPTFTGISLLFWWTLSNYCSEKLFTFSGVTYLK